jgi:hypothetical protein
MPYNKQSSCNIQKRKRSSKEEEVMVKHAITQKEVKLLSPIVNEFRATVQD